MATGSKLVAMRPRTPAKGSPLTPELKEFIDRAIVPALVKQYLAELDSEGANPVSLRHGQNDLAGTASAAANSQGNTAAPELRTMRP